MTIQTRFFLFFILHDTLIFGSLTWCSPSLAAQNIPQAVYWRGEPTKLAETPSQEGTLVLELMVRGLNMPHSAVWVPLSSVRKTFVDRYNQFSGDQRGAWLISEQKGGLWVLFEETLYPLHGLPQKVEKMGEGGYLDLLYSSQLGRIFLSYAKKVNAVFSTVAVLAFTLEYVNQSFRIVGFQEIFVAQPPLKGPIAYRASLSATQEFLYIALGSGGQPLYAQEPQSHWGTVNKIPLRQNAFPIRQRQIFPDAVSSSLSVQQQPRFPSQMLSLGHGDIQSMFWDPFQHRLWLIEQLRRTDGTVLADELNLLREGGNYNWGAAESFQKLQELENLRRTGFANPAERANASSIPRFLGRAQEPELIWERSYGWSSILVLPPMNRNPQSRDKNLFAAWAGDMLITSLQGQSLYRMKILPDPNRESGLRIELQEQLLNSYLGPLRWIGLGPDGALYLLAYSIRASGARMLRLSPKSRMFAK